MQTDYLRYFIDVATFGSMSAAAKKNFMSPQGISRSISALESELGCELFQRDSNKVTLTHFGERLLLDARKLVAQENDLRRSVIGMQSEQLKKSRMHFICYSSHIFFETPLFFPVAGFGFAPYGKVQFFQRSTSDVIDLLADAARVTQPEIVIAGGLGFIDLFADENAQQIQRLIDAGYEYRPLIHTQDYVLVPEYSTLARKAVLSKTEIRSHRLAVAAGGVMERAITRHIGSDSIYVSAADGAFRANLCRMGDAITFVPGISLVFGTPEGTVAVPMEEPYTIEIGFAARTDSFESGVLAEVIERLSSFYERYQDDGTFNLLDVNQASSLSVS